MKDSQNHDLSFYQNGRVLMFLESKGVKISFHIHVFKVVKKDHVILVCDGCGLKLDAPGLSQEEASEYIDRFFKNSGYAFID